jgi:diguanylate cyclase (GGDEF)-like protein
MRNFTQELTVKLIVVSTLLAAIFIAVAGVVILSMSKDAIKNNAVEQVAGVEGTVRGFLESGEQDELVRFLTREALRTPYNIWVASLAGDDIWSPDPAVGQEGFAEKLKGASVTLQWAAPRPIGGGEMLPEVLLKDIPARGFREGFGTYRLFEEERVIAFRVLKAGDGGNYLLWVDEPVSLASSQYATVKQYILLNSLFVALLVFTSTGIGIRWIIRPYYRRVEEMNIHLEEMNSRLESANRQMERYTLNLTKFYEITRNIFQSVRLDERLLGILNGAQEVLGIDRILIMLPDEKRQNLKTVGSVGEYSEQVEDLTVPVDGQGGILAQAFTNGEVMTVDKPEERDQLELAVPYSQMESLTAIPCAVVPLQVKGQSIGILKVDNKLSGRPFNEDDLKLLEIYAGQAAAAVENARLYEQLKGLIDELDRKVDELSIIQQISNTMQSMIREEQLLPFILRGLQESLHFDRVALFLKEEDGGYVGKLGIGVEEDRLRGLTLYPQDGPVLITAAAGKRKAVVALSQGKDDILDIASVAPLDQLQIISPKEMGQYTTGVVVAVPMVTKDEILGIIVADRYVSGQAVTMEDLKSFNTFANTVGLAVERARLHHRLQSQIEELKVTDHLTGLISPLHFREIVDQAIPSSRAEGKPFSLALVRIDRFADYNRIAGVNLGDRVLRSLAAMMKDGVPKGTVVARYAGGSIGLVFPGSASDQAMMVAGEIRRLFEEHPFEKEKAVSGGILTVSAGVTCLKDDDRVGDELFSRAEDALQLAIEAGGNRVALDPTIR